MIDELRALLLQSFGRRGATAVGLVLGLAALFVGGSLAIAVVTSPAFLVVVLALVLFGPATWVLLDAHKRGVRNPLLWALVALFGNVVGALVYRLRRDDQPLQRPCSNCGGQVSSSHAACPWCGCAQSSHLPRCGQCQNELEASWRFCPFCRVEVRRDAPTA